MGLFSNFSFLKRSAPEPAPATEPTPEPETTLAAAPPTTELVPLPPAEPVPLAPVEPVPLPPVEPVAPIISIQARAQAEAIVQRVAAELPNFVAVAVIDSASGRILAGQWAGNRTGEIEAAAANAEVIRQVRQATVALQLAPAEEVRDILITLRQQLHLLQVLPQHDWLLYLAIRTEDTNLALARTVLRQHAA